MTRWPHRARPPRVEPPEWVRVFHREDWAEPDEFEGRHGDDLPESWRRWHAERRWVLAVNEWYRQHPGDDYRLEDLIARRERRRRTAEVTSPRA